MRLPRRLAGCLVGLAIGLFCPVARAQPAEPPHLSDATLDALLAARDWNALGTALSLPGSAVAPWAMGWLHGRVDAGGGFFLAMLYARDLWIFGQSRQVADPAEDARVTAGMMTLYTLALIVVDGARCEDRSAPGGRLEQIIFARHDTLAYLKNLPAAWRAKVVDAAVRLEKATAPVRTDDDLVCRGGLASYGAALRSGTVREAPGDGSHYGRTVEAAPPAAWQPKFLAPSVYGPLQQQARAGLPSLLGRFVDVKP